MVKNIFGKTTELNSSDQLLDASATCTAKFGRYIKFTDENVMFFQKKLSLCKFVFC